MKEMYKYKIKERKRKGRQDEICTKRINDARDQSGI